MPGERRYTSLNTPFLREPMSEARRLHVHSPLQSAEQPYDPRKGTIRGFLAVCSVVGMLAFAWGLLP